MSRLERTAIVLLAILAVIELTALAVAIHG